MIRRVLRPLQWSVFLFFGLLSNQLFAEIRFDSSFESGNGTNFSQTGETSFSFEIEPDTNSTDRQWFCFRVYGAAEKTLTFHLQNIGTTNIRHHWATARPVISQDGGLTWRHITGSTSVSSTVFSFTHSFRAEPEYVAFHFPYSYSMLRERLSVWAKHPDVSQRVIGQSVEGRDIYLLRITNKSTEPPGGKLGFWIIARQHAGEVTSSFVVEGFMDFLLSSAEEAQSLRDWAVVNVVPMVNPDGVVAGNYRDNAAGMNLNRVWEKPDVNLSPEVFYIQKSIQQWVNEGNSYDFFADVHSTSGAFPHFAFHANTSVRPNLYHKPKDYSAHSKKFLRLVNKHNPDFDHLRGAGHSLHTALARDHQTFTYGVLAFTFEGGYNQINFGADSREYITPERHKAIGKAMARALYDYFSIFINADAFLISR